MLGKYLYKIGITGTACLLFIASSCKKFTEVAPPKNFVLGENVFTDSLSTTSAIAGIYTTLNSSALIGGNTSAYLSESADELTKINGGNDNLQLENNNLASSNGATASLWAGAYSVIADANACLAGLPSSQGISAGTRQKYIAEAKFIRAFCYTYLVNLYGDVPLAITNNYQQLSTTTRSPATAVYQQIVADLLDAQAALPDSYSSGNTRATKWAATALLARIYLYQQKWADAEAQAKSAIDNSGASMASLNEVFLIGSTETIWQLEPPTFYKNAVDYAVLYGFGFGYALTPGLLNAFEAGDGRKTTWVLDDSANSGNYLPYKYQANTYAGNPTQYTVMLRLAETYLIRAEALARQNKTTQAVADLNIIRDRAGLAPLSTTLTQAQCIAAIEQERRVELFAEWGNRWLDLKRMTSINTTGKTRADEVLGALKGSKWQSTDLLYPVPYNDIQLNKNLTQNPGY